MLTIIECPDNVKRRKIHQFLDGKVGKVSLFCKKFEISKKSLLVKTFHSCKSYTYNYDDYFNNPENRFYMNEYIIRESNYPMLISGHNMIAYGKYLRNYAKPKHSINADISEDEYNQIISELNVFTIPEPDVPLNKRDLSYYIVIQLDKYYGPDSSNPRIVQPIYYPGLGTPVVKQKGDLSGKY